MKQKNVVATDAGGRNLLQGWAFADDALRVLAGQQPLLDLASRRRYLTRAISIPAISYRRSLPGMGYSITKRSTRSCGVLAEL